MTLKKFEGKLVAADEIYIENQQIIKKRKIKKIISIILLSFLYPISIFIESIAKDKIYREFSDSLGILIYILYYVAFSYLILNSKIYNHQIISLALIFFCLLVCSFIDIFKKNKNSINFNRFLITILYFAVTFGHYSVYDNIMKKYLNTYSENPYELMFYIGIFSLILIVFLDLFLLIFKTEIFGLGIIKQIIELFSSSPINILWFIFDIIFGLLYEIGIVLTIYYFTPSHFIISQTFKEFLTLFIGWIIAKKYENSYFIYVFLYCIIFFSSLIYNEIIIIKLFNMEKNTYKYISFRQKMEFEDIQNIGRESSITRNSGSSFELNDDGGEDEERNRFSDL